MENLEPSADLPLLHTVEASSTLEEKLVLLVALLPLKSKNLLNTLKEICHILPLQEAMKVESGSLTTPSFSNAFASPLYADE